MPSFVSTSIGDAPLETRARYLYDDSLNVCSIETDAMVTVYLWSYKGQYPIAKIEGLTYAKVKAAIGEASVKNMLSKSEPSAADYKLIRDAVNTNGGLITTYTYKPLVGMTSATLPNGLTTKYEYDAFGRLSKVIDHNGMVVSANEYNYKK